MSEGEYKKISIGSTLKLLPPSTPMSTGFRVGDMMISISIEGTYPPDADPVKVRMDLEKFFTEIYRFPSVQMPKIIDGGVVELNRSIPPVMGASGTGKVSGSLSVGGTAQGGQGAGQGANTPNVNLSGMSAKPESKAESGQVAKPVAPPPANQPAQSANQPSAKNPEAGKVNLTPAVQGTPAGKPQPTPPKQEQGKHDQALEKLLAIFEKMRKEAPFSNLVFAEPTDDPSAYVDIERWLAC